MSNAAVNPFRNRLSRLRRSVAQGLIGFLIAVAIAPHQHRNSISDILSDGPSNSGVILEEDTTFDVASGPRLSRDRFIDDVPCLACFHHDFAAAAALWFQQTAILRFLGQAPKSPRPEPPEPSPEDPASRSPPSLSS
jgi:hypothetical protein